MLDNIYPGRVLYRQKALARAPQFQIETAIVLTPDVGKRVFKRALHPAGIAHLQRMEANRHIMQTQQDASLAACSCVMRGDMLELEFIEGVSLKQKLIQAIQTGNPGELAYWLERYQSMVVGFDQHASAWRGPNNCADFSADIDRQPDKVVLSGNIDQGFDHWIIQPERVVLIDYEWVLGFPVPIKYVLYRAAQLFFQDVPPLISPEFRLRDMCAYFAISAEDRLIFDRMEAKFQLFVRSRNEHDAKYAR